MIRSNSSSSINSFQSQACSTQSSNSSGWSSIATVENKHELASYLRQDLPKSLSYQTNDDIRCTLCANADHNMHQQYRRCAYESQINEGLGGTII